MTRIALLLLAALLAACASKFDLQGHRGARGLAPENTLPAFARALEIGVTTLELDTALTRDGVVVVAHDARPNPDIARLDGRWLDTAGPAIHDLTFAELSRYDIGRLRPDTPYARDFPEQVAVDGTGYARLSEVFALVRRSGARRVRFNIETKLSPLAAGDTAGPEDFARAVIAEIRGAGMARRSTLQSFDWRTLQVAQRDAPEIETAYLTSQQRFDNVCTGAAAGKPTIAADECGPSPWTAGFQLKQHRSVPRMVKAAGGAVWSPDHRDLDAARLEEAHALGLRVVAWTVNDPARIAALMDLGADGIISDRPDRVRAELARRGLPLP